MSQHKIFKYLVDVHYSHMDLYGHINSTHYLDYIMTSRWLFAAKNGVPSPNDMVKRGIGFFLVNSNINYLKAIDQPGSLLVSSFVSESESSKLTVEFEIKSADETKIYSNGKLLFVVVDLATKKAQKIPSWVHEIFFEKKPEDACPK